eukprot:1190828-Prorocentrum_minimum.AAC.2
MAGLARLRSGPLPERRISSLRGERERAIVGVQGQQGVAGLLRGGRARACHPLHFRRKLPRRGVDVMAGLAPQDVATEGAATPYGLPPI